MTSLEQTTRPVEPRHALGRLLASLRPAPDISYGLSQNPASVGRRMILDLARRRASETPEVQVLYLLAIIVGSQVTALHALLIAYVLVQFSEIHGLMLVRRIFAAARDPDDMLERFAGPAVLYEWLSAALISLAIAVGFVNTIPGWQLGALAFWCLATTYFVFPTIYCTRSLYGCIAIQLFGMVITVSYTYFTMGKPAGVALASLGLTFFAATTAIFIGRQLRADYVAQLDKERALAISLRELDRLNASKTQFVAHLSHEMRTPLNGMMGVAALLQRADLSTEAAQQVEIVLRSGRVLKELLDDSLDMARLEENAIKPVAAAASLRRVIDEAASLYRPIADSRGLEIVIDLEDNIPEQMLFDLLRVRQCISNLLSNAVKFSKDGTIRLSAKVTPGQPAWLVSITVEDPGIGIPADMQEAIFDPYAQADLSPTRRFQGAGLGLSISRQLARLMGGDITVASEPGKGSAFTFSFSARPVA